MSAAIATLDAEVLAEAVLAVDQLADSQKLSSPKAATGNTDRGADLVHCLLWRLSWNKCRW